ncbi:ATP-binding Cassette (ABC) Superfamily [Phytophthora infestans T30-4]|uniref:ATP-binding Cassette (ABC) Superfamily n=1 Tax=Phytophthora infestans (strain T30-4) TaxID=403677 RepID=D0NUP3_PHYIT|nr:ATP-binding Cassette (ABC) Superfamily [Phytophthora infestans T30-4]EEY65389.1 ATP-binding Cassette (ABC) Superfamily [Phytophthora infestans T30-4]|eukprot:XP_002897252.1 ATP-binding Cassette (ABC) Superfamily [Phytophthora infestans T30-4]
MRRSIQSRSDAKAVDIANIYSSDIQRVIQLYVVLGISAFAGLVVIALSMLAAFFFTKQTSGSYKELMKRKDDRMKLVKEAFGAIQIVKLNAWEGKFDEKLLALRELELSELSRFVYAMCGTIFVLWTSPLFVSTASFAYYTLVKGQVLTAAKVFTAIALFNLLRDPLREFPSMVQKCLQAKISLDRMADYLALHEVDSSSVTRNDSSIPEDVAILVEHGTFAWNEDAKPVLADVNLIVKKGDFVVVHGPVGSGKFSLCSALLGEMEKMDGKVTVNGKVAYYAQQPWIQSMTIRENILFGQVFDHTKYQSVLNVCGLLPDLQQFAGGDATEIGQKGINLSGGQKARVSLARACYSDADIFILDSPLAAVDAMVQSEIFSKCICGLLAEKTVIFVTHNQDVIESGAEKREEGRVSAAVIWQYFNAMGGLKVLVLLLLIQSLWQGCQVGML